MDKFTELNEKYNAFDFYEEKIEDNFLEFTLEELGMPSAEWLYEQTLKISDDIGGIRGWQRDKLESEKYKGFSICINPNKQKIDPKKILVVGFVKGILSISS